MTKNHRRRALWLCLLLSLLLILPTTPLLLPNVAQAQEEAGNTMITATATLEPVWADWDVPPSWEVGGTITFPLSPIVAHAITEKERRESITQALQDIVEEFGWDAGEVRYYYTNDCDFSGEMSSWYLDVDSTVSTGCIRITEYCKAEAALRQLNLKCLGGGIGDQEYLSSVSFHGYPGGSYTTSKIIEHPDGDRLHTLSDFFWVSDIYFCQVNAHTFGGGLSAKEIAEVVFSNLGDLLEKPENQPPVASFDIFPPHPTPDDSITFVNTSTDEDNDPLAYEWYLDGDYKGSFLSYGLGKLEPGEHTITLFVDDVKGGKDEVSRTITIGLPVSLETSASPEEVPQIVTEEEEAALRASEEAKEVEEEISENKPTYDELKTEAPEGGTVDKVTLIPPEGTEEELADIQPTPQKKKAYILTSPELGTWHRIIMWPKKKAIMNLFEREGYELVILEATDENIRTMVADSDTDALAYFGHNRFPTLENYDANGLQSVTTLERRKRYMEQGMSSEEAKERVKSERFEVKYFYNHSCYSLGEEDKMDTSLFDGTLGPGGIGWGHQGNLHMYNTLTKYTRP